MFAPNILVLLRRTISPDLFLASGAVNLFRLASCAPFATSRIDFIRPSPEDLPSFLSATLLTDVGLLSVDSSEPRVSQSSLSGGKLVRTSFIVGSTFSGCDDEAASIEDISTPEIGEEGVDSGCASSCTGIGWSRSRLGKKSSRWLISASGGGRFAQTSSRANDSLRKSLLTSSGD